MMETLVVIPPHRNQYFSGDKSQGSSHHFGSSPSKCFRDINCRAFESGLLPTPFRTCSTPKPYKSPLPSPKTPTTSSYTNPFSKSEDAKHHLKKNPKSCSPIPINLKGGGKKVTHLTGSISISEIWGDPTCPNTPLSGGRGLNNIGRKKEWAHVGNSYSERWAGPTYSNSPPPSCLPMPKFSVTKPKRTVSLELPRHPGSSDPNLPSVSKTAPTSPTRESNCSSPISFFDDDSATKTLRRILNLDGGDD